MGNLFRFILRYHVLLVFLLLEGIAIFMLTKTTFYQQSVILSRVDATKGYVMNVTSRWISYLSLAGENNKLAEENNRLLNYIDQLMTVDSTLYLKVRSDDQFKSYIYISAKVVSNTINRKDNYLILNAGRKQGVKRDMGVISPQGVVGSVERVSDNFCTVMSLLNTKRDISAMLKKTGHYAPLVWDGKDPKYANIVEMPQHVPVALGDTIVTSGQTNLFPEGVLIGIVASFELEKGVFYNIRVKLSTDFQSVHYVNIIDLVNRSEIETLQSEIDKQ